MISQSEEIDNVPVWWFIGNVTDADKQLIEEHMNACEFLTQVHYGEKDLLDVAEAIDAVKEAHAIPLFVHVYPDPTLIDSVVSLYCKKEE